MFKLLGFFYIYCLRSLSHCSIQAHCWTFTMLLLVLFVCVFLYVECVCFFVFFFFVYAAIEFFLMNKVDYNATLFINTN